MAKRELEYWESRIYGDWVEIRERLACEFLDDQPQWHPGTQGLEIGKPVWALTYDLDFKIVRGCGTGSQFMPFKHVDAAGRERRIEHVFCWADCEAQPEISPAMVEAAVTDMADRHARNKDDFETDHMLEDWLRDQALRAVCDGHPVGVAIARAALETSEIKFTRYCA